MLGGSVSLATANLGGNVAWIVPTYKNGRSLWRWAEKATGDGRKAGVIKANKTDRLMEFPSGGLFGIYSADSEDSIRGEAFHLVVVDEAARISETAWTDAIMPTLADHDGDAILISTPKGLNWFHDEWVRGTDDGVYQASWNAPSSDNPMPQIQRAFEKVKGIVPQRTFQQEWLAEFVKDGAYFQNIENAATVLERDLPSNHEGHTLFMAVDWGKSNDWTIIGVGCRECKRVVDWERFNKIDYIYQRERLKSMRDIWQPRGILPERNSMGEPNVEMLVAEEYPIIRGPDGKYGFYTSPTTKPPLIEGLSLAFTHHGFTVPKEAATELMVYEVNILDSGYSKFGAPDNQHDDWVMMLGLLWWAMEQTQWLMA